MKNKEIIKEAQHFVATISKNDKAAVLHHTDADGVCSGVLAAKAVEASRGKKADFAFCQKDGETSVTEETILFLKKKGINKTIITDLAVDAMPETIRQIERFSKILIIDHHLKVNELSSKETILVKAQDISDIEPSKYPASKMVYDIFAGSLGNYAWIAGIGIIGDYSERAWADFIHKTTKSGATEKDLRAAEEIIGYARATKHEKGVEEAFRVIYSAGDLSDVLQSSLAGYRDAVEAEIDACVKAHKKSAFFSGDTIIYEVKAKYNIKSRLANIISQQLYPEKTVILLQIGKNRVDLSARRQDMKKSMAELVRKATEGIPDSLGGGHVPAAGGYFPREYLDEVKKRLISSASQS